MMTKKQISKLSVADEVDVLVVGGGPTGVLGGNGAGGTSCSGHAGPTPDHSPTMVAIRIRIT
jgi:ABC-type lipopolysaccharide export system ATPase subunit